METDRELIEAFKKGDQEAFAQLITKYKQTVFRAIYSLVPRQAEADDLAQEVFLQVYDSIDSYKYKSAFSTWLYRITVNKCYYELRKKKRHVSLEAELSDTAGKHEGEALKMKDLLVDDQESAEDRMINKETQELVRKLLGTLPEKYRMILTLKEIENLSYLEIARIMDISMDKVKVWLFRARLQLREKLLPYYQ